MLDCRFPFQHEADECDCQPRVGDIILRLAEIDAAERAQQARKLRLCCLLAMAVLIPVFILAASVGLARAEREYQTEARV